MEIPVWDAAEALINAALFLIAIFIATTFRLYDYETESFKDITLKRFVTVFIGALIAGFVAWFVVLGLASLMDAAAWVEVLSMAVLGMVGVSAFFGLSKDAIKPATPPTP